MSADLGPDPDEQRHAELLAAFVDLRRTMLELISEVRAVRLAVEREGLWLRQELREARR